MNKNIAIFPFMFLISLFLVSAAFECNVSSPLQINQGTNISIKVNTLVPVDNTNLYAEIYMHSVSQTQNSSAKLIANVTNTSSRFALNFTMPSFDALILQDGSDYTVGAVVWNGTVDTKANFDVNRTACTNTTGRNLDRTKPSLPTSITFSNPVEDGETVTATINRSDSNECFIRFGSVNAPRLTMTLSGSTCTFTPTKDNPSNGAYEAYVEANDKTNATLSLMQNIEISTTKSDGGGLFSGAQIQLPSSQGLQGALGITNNPFASNNQGLKQLFGNPVALFLIGLVVYMLLNKKK